MLEQINDAERRAREAERKAREAVVEVALPETAPELPKPLPPEPDPAPIASLLSDEAPEAVGLEAPPEPDSPAAESEGTTPDADAGADIAGAGGSAADPVPPSSPDAEDADAAGEAPSTAAKGEDQSTPPTAAEAGRAAGTVSLNSATFEEALREVGLSVTQTGRVLAYREHSGGFTSISDLDGIPAFRMLSHSVKDRLVP